MTINYPDIVEETLETGALFGGELISVGKFKQSVDPRNRGPYSISVIGNRLLFNVLYSLEEYIFY